nr:YraN family protein [uncultured Eisenbergiella sp.]
MNKREIGESYEEAACLYLRKKGIRITERNFRCRQGEVDLIGRDGDYLVFFEVKFRKNKTLGYPEEAVGYAKQKKICKVADYYLYQKRLGESIPVRFDVVAICGESVNWYQNAFDYIGGY